MTRLIGLVLRYRRRPGRHAGLTDFHRAGHDASPQALELARFIAAAERAEMFSPDEWRYFGRTR